MTSTKALNLRSIRLIVALFALTISACIIEDPEPTEIPPFEIGTTGCPMAHCDAQMTDNAQQVVPNDVTLINHTEIMTGSNFGIGCVSNGVQAACSYARFYDALEVYDYDGTRLWGSGYELSYESWASAPIIDQAGHVIATDDEHIVRYDEAGNQVWAVDIPGGHSPISPIINSQGIIMLATRAGLVSTYDPDGPQQALDQVWVSLDSYGRIVLKEVQPLSDGFLTTANTPAFNLAGDRAYVLMANELSEREGALVAFDVQADGQLSLAWSFPFQGPSGASPLVIENVGKDCETDTGACKTVIYFDGRYDLSFGQIIGNSEVLAVEDQGVYPELLWSHREKPAEFMDRRKTIQASFASDPRGCMWYYASSYDRAVLWHTKVVDPDLRCLAYEDGELMMEVNPGCLLGNCDGFFPSSIVTMAQDETGAPILIFNLTGTLTDNGRPIYIVAIKPEMDGAHTLLWSFEYEPVWPYLFWHFNSSQGQFAILEDPEGTDGGRTIFTTNANGLYVIGESDSDDSDDGSTDSNSTTDDSVNDSTDDSAGDSDDSGDGSTDSNSTTDDTVNDSTDDSAGDSDDSGDGSTDSNSTTDDTVNDSTDDSAGDSDDSDDGSTDSNSTTDDTVNDSTDDSAGDSDDSGDGTADSNSTTTDDTVNDSIDDFVNDSSD